MQKHPKNAFSSARKRAEKIYNEAWPHVEGWSGQLDSVRVTMMSAAYQYDHDVEGAICEIGVHHGRFYLLLDAMRRSRERAVAIDLFEDQVKNTDNSGEGDRGIFLDHLRTYSHDANATELIAGDTLVLNSNQILQATVEKVRLFSVDGGHTSTHAANDLALADQVLHDHGVVIVDDYFDPAWAGVHVGTLRYLTSKKNELIPFAATRKKLYLCKKDVYDSYFNYFRVNENGLLCGFRMRVSDYDTNKMISIIPY